MIVHYLDTHFITNLLVLLIVRLVVVRNSAQIN